MKNERKIEIQQKQSEIREMKEKIAAMKPKEIEKVPDDKMSGKIIETDTPIGDVTIYGYSLICKLPADVNLHLIYSKSLENEKINTLLTANMQIKNCKVELTSSYKHLLKILDITRCVDTHKIEKWMLENPATLLDKYRILNNYFAQFKNFIEMTQHLRSTYGAYFIRNNERTTFKLPRVVKERQVHVTIEFEFDASHIESYNDSSDPFRPVRTRINVITGNITEIKMKETVDRFVKDQNNSWMILLVEKISNPYEYDSN